MPAGMEKSESVLGAWISLQYIVCMIAKIKSFFFYLIPKTSLTSGSLMAIQEEPYICCWGGREWGFWCVCGQFLIPHMRVPGVSMKAVLPMGPTGEGCV